MTEQRHIDTAHDYIFDTLEAVYMDPLIKRVLDEAMIYNDMLGREYVSDDEITDIVTEIDNQWRFLLGQEATATGNMAFIDVNDMSDDPQPVVSYHENQDVTFNGIVARKLRTLYGSGNVITEDTSDPSTYELRVQLVKEGIDANSDVAEMTGSVALTDLISLEFQQMMSPDRAQKWLSHFHPEVIDEIDICLLNPSLEECEMVMRLKGMVVDLSVLKDETQDLIGVSKVALGVYLESLFDFDKDVPYSVVAEGEVWAFNEQGAVVSRSISAASLAKVHKVIWQPGTEDDDYTVRPQLDLEFLGSTKDTDNYHVLVPIAVIEDFASLRYDFFHGYPTDEPEPSV